MKILVFNWQDVRNPLAGGAEVHFHQIFSRIARLGHEVTLYCSSFDGAPCEECIDGIRVIREGGRYFFNFRVFWKYIVRFRKEGYDVVIDDTNKIPFFTPLYVREPLAAIVHHLFGKSIFREAPFPLALYVYLMENLGMFVFRHRRIPMFVVSPSTRHELLAKGFRDKLMEYMYNCVDHDLHHPDGTPKAPEPFIGYFGRLKKYKSADHLIRAMASARRQVPDLHLVVIGEGDHRPELERLTAELGLSDCIRFTGFVPEEEKVRLLRQTWFLVNTSAKEGWGLTVVEANACGTPVIGSNVPGLRDAIRDNETGLLFEYGNTEQLAGMIVSLARDTALRNRLSASAIEWAKTFDWMKVAEQSAQSLELLRQGKWRRRG